MSADPLATAIMLNQRQADAIQSEANRLQAISVKRKACSGPIGEAILYLKSEFMDLDKVLAHFPQLGNSRDFWVAFLAEGKDLPRFLGFAVTVAKCATHLLTTDRDLVVQLCTYDAEIYTCLSSPIVEDEKVVEAALEKRPLLLYNLAITEAIQRRHPQLVVSALRRLTTVISNFIGPREPGLASMLDWSNRDIVLAWGLAGGCIRNNGLGHALMDDEEVVLAFLHHSDGISYDRSVILNLSRRLCAKKEVMMQAIAAHPSYLKLVATELVGDEELLLAAMSSSSIFVLDRPNFGAWLLPNQRFHDFWLEKSDIVKRHLTCHAVFVKLILCGVSVKVGNATPLTLLSHGNETAVEAFAKPIAEFLCVPTGKKLTMLRKARDNLDLKGISWADDSLAVIDQVSTRKRKSEELL